MAADVVIYGSSPAALTAAIEAQRHGKSAVIVCQEKRIGDGRVNFPQLIKKLKEHGYDGDITIEREISGEEQVKDVIYAKKFLEDIIND